MAKIRIGFSTELNIGSELSGIGTDNPTNTKQVLGNIHASNAKAIGVSTLTTYQGFLDKEAKISNNIDINSQAGTLGEIVIDGDVTVSSGSTLCSGVDELTLTDSFSIPTGNTDSRIHCQTAGSMRFNEDLGTLEFYTGDEWRTVNSFKDTGNRGRGLFGGGVSASPANDSRIEFFNMATKGNSTTFGDRTISANNASACSSATRALFCGGGSPGGENVIDYVTIASEGDAIDFGDRTSKQFSSGSCGSSTRGLTGGGNPASNIIDYHQFSTLGDSLDFGDLNATQFGIASASSSVSGFWLGGTNLDGIIQKVTIASTGNAIDFGNLIEKTKNGRACSNTTRLIKGAGVDNENRLTIESFNMASGGNSVFFGNLTELSTFPAAMSSETRGIFCGGRTPTMHNIIQFITIATSGNAEDFGDITQPNQKMAGCSDSHGGLGGY